LHWFQSSARHVWTLSNGSTTEEKVGVVRKMTGDGFLEWLAMSSSEKDLTVANSPGWVTPTKPHFSNWCCSFQSYHKSVIVLC
jgi:antibiotic biosynthesis monooxygenase (ABM) superfamily enzyme